MQRDFLTKAIKLLLFLVLLFGGMYFARKFLVPLVFAMLMAMLGVPVVRKLEAWHIPRIFASMLTVMLFLLIFSAATWLISAQMYSFIQDMEGFQAVLENKLELVDQQLTAIGLQRADDGQSLYDSLLSLIGGGGDGFQKVLTTTTGFISGFFLIVVYMFFFLFFRRKFYEFGLNVVSGNQREKAMQVMEESSSIAQRYLGGMLISIIILTVLNLLGLAILGVEHALIFAMIAAVLNLVPYIGTFVGGALPVLYVLVTRDSLADALIITAIFLLIQFLDNNFIVPAVVGSKVRINPFAAVLSLILGGVLWGVPGMIIFIPLLGIFNIVCLHVDELKPISILIGEKERPFSEFQKKIRDRMMRFFRPHS